MDQEATVVLLKQPTRTEGKGLMWFRRCLACRRSGVAAGEQCQNCGAKPGETAPARLPKWLFYRYSKNGYTLYVESLHELRKLFVWLNLPVEDLGLVLNRPRPGDAEPEWDASEDLVWPSLDYPRRALDAIQPWFYKYPHKAGKIGNVLGRPSDTAARIQRLMGLLESRFRWFMVLSGLGFVAMLCVFFASERWGPEILRYAGQVLLIGLLLTVIAFLWRQSVLAREIVELAKPDIRRQVVRYLDWARACSREPSPVDVAAELAGTRNAILRFGMGDLLCFVALLGIAMVAGIQFRHALARESPTQLPMILALPIVIASALGGAVGRLFNRAYFGMWFGALLIFGIELALVLAILSNQLF